MGEVNRVIKFRGWDKKTNTLFKVGGFANMDYDINNEYRYVTIAGGKPNTRMSATPRVKDIILMQFTGLLDHNGTEIYESDLLKNGDVICECQWSSDYAGWMFKQVKNYNPKLNTDELEVLGNVYQHSHLLEEK